MIASKVKFYESIDCFSKTKIFVLGDLMVDKYIYGKVSRISPEAPVPVVEVTNEKTMPGGAGNVANNIAALGGEVFLSGTVGTDNLGKELIAELSNQGINIEGIFEDDSRPTTLKTRIIAHHQQVVRCDWENRSHLSLSINKKILNYLKNIISKVDCIIISDYGKGVVNPFLLSKIISLTHAYSKVIIVDPKVEHFLRYRKVTIVTPNLVEAMAGMHWHRISSEKDIEELGKKILKKLNCLAVLITLGEKGMILFQYSFAGSKLQITKIPTAAKEVYDVTGAGDTVVGVLSLGIASGLDIHDSAYLANYAAGIVVGKLGTATVTTQELKETIISRGVYFK
ncbi:MAG TPA: D-glycero-beta-D-manno-heptose-7-phosphate kinase [Elusimicrobia bacterium]|nr:D-glycero-beta-D-manno-heptose-7-phosphate kinase [Elusimicrobiota bacterium]